MAIQATLKDNLGRVFYSLDEGLRIWFPKTQFQQHSNLETWNLKLETISMSKVQRFEDLTIFQMARDLCKDVYAITKDGEFHKDMRFVQQIHAAAGSIMDNIAEGYERDGNKEFINFLYIAKGSCGEVRSQIIRATDVGFIDKDTAKKLYNDSLNLSKAISKFITSLKGSPITGLKHLKPESWNLNLNLLKLESWNLKQSLLTCRETLYIINRYKWRL